MTQAIRLSPSGPVIANANGGPFTPGPGAQLRLVEASTTITGTLTIPTAPAVIGDQLGAGNPLVVNLPSPDSDLEYRVTVLCDVVNPTTNVSAAVELYIETSSDGLTWAEQASNSHVVGFSGARQIRCDMKLKAGSALGVGTAMYARAKLGASTNGGVVVVSSPGTPGDASHSVGTVLLQLAECF